MGTRAAKQWIIRDAEGKIYGPFSTDEVLTQIDRNYFLGGEQVMAYPGGNWMAISKAPEFYDRLLDVLAAEVSGNTNQTPKPSDAPDFASKIRPQTSADATANSNDPRTRARTSATATEPAGKGLDQSRAGTQNSAQVIEPDEITRTMHAPVIELTDLKALERLEKLKASKVPLAVIAATLVVLGGFFFFSSDESSPDKRVHLLTPRKGQSEISDAKQKEKYQRAMSSLVHDTFTSYVRAENELVELIEGVSPNPDAGMKKASALSSLCLVYRELWPYAYQDSQDLKAVALVTQEAKRIDPAGLNGTTCEIVNLMLTGRYRDAQGLVESILLEQTQAPQLYEIRGDLYLYNQDYLNAAEYFKIAKVLWPAWQKSSVQEARARAKLQQFPQALQLYSEVVKRVGSHAVAKIEMGIIEGLQFSQYDKAVVLIDAGVSGSEKVPRQILSAGYFGLAQIYMRKNQTPRALENAQRAYSLNSGNMEAKAMIVALAGEAALKGLKFKADELVYLGDQYMRSGDCFSAQAQYKAAFDSDNKNAFAALKAGKCLWQLNQTAEAMEWLRKAILADSKLIAAYVELADYSAQRYDFYAAAEVLKRAQARSPKSFEIYRGFAQLELRRHNFQGAVTQGLRALKLYETDMDTLLLMAKANMGLQNYVEAQRFAALAIDLDSNNIEAQSLYGRIDAGLHGVDAGAGYIQNLINRFVITKGQQVPQAAIEYRIALSEVYMVDERFKLAEEALRQAINLDRNSKRALIALGKVMQAQNFNQEALELFLRAAVLDPSDADPIYLSGQIYLDAGKIQDAAKQYERVLKINTRYPKGHAQLGRVYLRMNDGKKALEEALAERAINPELADSYVLAAEGYFALKQYTNCAAEYQKAVGKLGQDTVILVRMARCYRLAGALDSAGSLLRQATTLESGNPDIYKEQGAIYHMKGMADEAITNYDTYLRLAPNASDRGEVETLIRKVQAGDLTVGN
jgi:tetratricopeptide (TPR) repeat protein